MVNTRSEYGIKRLESKNARNAIVQKLAEDFNLTPIIAEAYYQQVSRYFEAHANIALSSGEIAYEAVADDEPAGKPIRVARKVTVRLRLYDFNSDFDVLASYGLAGLRRHRMARITRQAYYGLTMHFDPAQAEGLTRAQYLGALAAEGFSLGEVYDPVYRNPLLNMYDATSPIPYRDAVGIQNYAELRLPVCEQVKTETGVIMGHYGLLAEPAYIEQLIAAVDKVNANLAAVRAHFAAQDA